MYGESEEQLKWIVDHFAVDWLGIRAVEGQKVTRKRGQGKGDKEKGRKSHPREVFSFWVIPFCEWSPFCYVCMMRVSNAVVQNLWKGK